MASTNPGGNGNNPNDRPRLSENQKKQNHIVSEQKRRQAIRGGFDRLASIVPGMEGQGRSEAVVLQATVTEIERELRKRENLRKKATESGMAKEEFEDAYKAVDVGQVGNGQAGSPGSVSGNARGSKDQSKGL